MILYAGHEILTGVVIDEWHNDPSISELFLDIGEIYGITSKVLLQMEFW